MDAGLRDLVRKRAQDCCEYCGLPQRAVASIRFHVDHIVARQHGGGLDESNLAFACFHCNLHKGPNLSAVDPVTSRVVRLFHPRIQRWQEHFVVQGDSVVGLTEVGRATASLLQMNAPDRQEIRRLIRP